MADFTRLDLENPEQKSARPDLCRGSLVTQANSQHVYVRFTQPASHHIQLLEVFNRPNSHTMIGLVIDGDALNGGLYTLQRELRPAAIRVGVLRE
jgi:hypothetical protein